MPVTDGQRIDSSETWNCAWNLELRAMAGRAWFRCDSLQLVRLPD